MPPDSELDMTEPSPAAARVETAAPPALEARGARISVDGAVALDGLDLRTEGSRVILAGDFAPLLGVLLRTMRPGARPERDDSLAPSEARVVAGQLQLAGNDVASGDHARVAGLAPLDPPLPGRWTVVAYLRWAARLAGVSRRAERSLAESVLADLGLSRGAQRRIGTLALAERRAVVLAQAVVAGPKVLVADAPFAGLDAAAAGWLDAVLERASADRTTVLSVSRLTTVGAQGGLLARASDVCVFRRERLALHATSVDELAAQARWVQLSVVGAVEPLVEALSADGIELRGGPGCYVALVPRAPDANDERRATSRILAAAARSKVAVVRCEPIL